MTKSFRKLTQEAERLKGNIMTTQKAEYICRSEASRCLREHFPNHSAMVFCQVFQDAKIRTIFAGTEELISSSELHRWTDTISATPVKNANGFLVFDLGDKR